MHRFFKPTLLKVLLSVLCLGLTLKFITPLFAFLKLVPCKLVAQGKWGLCAINPSQVAQSLYLGFSATDFIYQLLYLGAIAIVIPYLLACTLFWSYGYIAKKGLNNDKD
jgi:hypothetical protein